MQIDSNKTSRLGTCLVDSVISRITGPRKDPERCQEPSGRFRVSQTLSDLVKQGNEVKRASQYDEVRITWCPVAGLYDAYRRRSTEDCTGCL